MTKTKKENGSGFSPLGFAVRLGSLVGKRLSFRIIYLSCFTGAAAGLVAVAFTYGLDFAAHYLQEVWAGYAVSLPAGDT